jgi:hypothetical protein
MFKMRKRKPKSERLEDAEAELADAVHELVLWGNHFGTRPSRKLEYERDVERARQKVDRIRAEEDDAVPPAVLEFEGEISLCEQEGGHATPAIYLHGAFLGGMDNGCLEDELEGMGVREPDPMTGKGVKARIRIEVFTETEE